MPKMSEIRAQFPMYEGVPDDQLLIGLHKKFYSDIPFKDFNKVIDRDTERAAANKELTDSMGGVEKFTAGAGKAFSDLGGFAKRVGNMAGIGDYDQKAAQADAQLDKPLMDTGAGMAGNVVGDLALTAVPGYRGAQVLTRATRAAAAGPGAIRGTVQALAPYIGGAGSGAALGAATNPADMATGATMGAAFGAGGELVSRALPATLGAFKATAIDPFTSQGQQRIVNRSLNRFATNPQAAQAAAASPRIITPGSRPTLAEATMDPGLASLERQFPADMAGRYAENNAARVRQLETLGGTPEDVAAMRATREAGAGSEYAPVLDGAPQLPMREGTARLMERPVVRDALRAGRELAENLGESPDTGMTVGRGLHYAKLALDTAFKTPGNPLAAHGQRAVSLNKRALLDELEHYAPGYADVSNRYRAMSAPVNAAETGNLLLRRGTGAVPNAAGDLPVSASKLSQALRGGDALAQTATGFNRATLQGTLGNTGAARAQAVADDAARAANAQTVGRGVGSPTAQNLAAQNLLASITGPLGIPESFLTSQLSNLVSGIIGAPMRLTQDQTQQLMVRAMQDPQLAARIMAARDVPSILQTLQPYVAQMVTQSGIRE